MDYDAPEKSAKSFWIVSLFVCCILARVAWQKSQSWSATAQASQLTFSESCQDKQKCVVLYVAPWCPVCERTLPVALEIGRRWSTSEAGSGTGLRILVGNDKPEKCVAKAQKIGPIAAVDQNFEFGKQYGIRSFPTWIVFDSSGHELNRVSGGIYDTDQADRFIHSALKI